VNPDDLAAVKNFADTKMSKTGFYEGKVADYLTSWPKRGEVSAKVSALEQQLFAARQPVAHATVVRPVR